MSNFNNIKAGFLSQNYYLIEKIGKGAHGIVKKIERKNDGKLFAMKVSDVGDVISENSEGIFNY